MREKASGRTVENPVVIRPCESMEEWTECVGLQAQVWKYTDLDVLPATIFADAADTGGQVLGAYLEGRLIGFSLAFAGLQNHAPYLHSNMTAVLPEFQSQGVGRLLKLAQRADGIARGFRHMEWTFDPLRIPNAHFNLVRLGAVVRRYLPNIYGTTSSPLHQGMPTDRLLAEWWWESERVVRILRGEPAPLFGETQRVGVPAFVDPNIQAGIRDRFQQLFQEDWAAAAFERTAEGGEYIFVPWPALAL